MSIARRSFLKGATAVAVGVAVEHGAPAMLNVFRNNLPEPEKSASSKIRDFEKNFRSKEFPVYAAETVVNDPKNRNRHIYLHDYYRTNLADNMPTRVRKILANVVPGLAAQESRYDNNRESKNGARGVMQVLPSTHAGVLPGTDLSEQQKAAFEAFINSYQQQVEFSFKYFDQIYQHYANTIDFKKLAAQFGLDSLQRDIFIVLCLMNGYSVGMGDFRTLLKHFVDNFDEARMPASYDGTALSLFNVFAEFYKNRKKNTSKKYGNDSSQYVFRSLTGGNRLNDIFGTSYGLPESGLLDDIVPSTQALVAAAAGYAVADTLQDPYFVKDSQNTGFFGRPVVNLAASSVRMVGDVLSGAGWVNKTAIAAVGGKTSSAPKSKPSTRKPLVRLKKAPAKTRSRTRYTSNQAPPTRRGFLKKTIVGGGAIAAGITAADYWDNREIDGSIFGYFDGEPNILEVDQGPEYSKKEVPHELTRLALRGIRLYSSGKNNLENGIFNAKNRTTFVGLNKAAWGTMEQMLENLGLLSETNEAAVKEALKSYSGKPEDLGKFLQSEFPINESNLVITGLAETGHSQRKYGHGNGFAADFREASAEKIKKGLLGRTEIVSNTSRSVQAEHPLRETGFLVGEKIFRYKKKYFLFGVKHNGKVFVCYLDYEPAKRNKAAHYHLEMIPWHDYDKRDDARKAGFRGNLAPVWRQEVRDYISENLS